ncbi:MAG TPA: hypothetical protein VLF66_15105 [Thermoanaerobaculia bacterium]|nr:hypothetical protein [Thermoanaerobaculia bacterium]
MKLWQQISSKRYSTAVILTMVQLMTLSLAPPAATAEDRQTPYKILYSWTSSSGDLQSEGLFLFSNSSQGIVSRFLIQTPEGSSVVLTKYLSAAQGWSRVVLEDDRTGWWAAVNEQYPVKGLLLTEFLQKLLEWYVPEEERHVTMSLESSGGLRFEKDVLIDERPSEMYAEFLDAMEQSDLAKELRTEIPDELSEAIFFLDAAFRRPDKRSVIDVLAGVLPQADSRWGYRGLGWEENEELAERGVTITSSELLAFISRFGSIDPGRPLGDDALLNLQKETPSAISSVQ